MDSAPVLVPPTWSLLLDRYRRSAESKTRILYVVFVDLTKAFDTVNRDGLWHVLKKLGCSEKFVNVVKSLHDGMEARVLDQGSFSATFNVSNGAKQGCVLAPTLFSIMFSMLIRDASMKQMTPAFT